MGRIEYFNAAKGYGFVKDADCGEKYFFHISSSPATIAEGDRVTFEIERGMRGMNAVRIIRILFELRLYKKWNTKAMILFSGIDIVI